MRVPALACGRANSGAGHGFFADYRPSYNAPAADAWKRCLAFFDKWLKA